MLWVFVVLCLATAKVAAASPSLRRRVLLDQHEGGVTATNAATPSKGITVGHVTFLGPLGTFVNGFPADYCMRLVDGKGVDCGQPAADSFCRAIEQTQWLHAVSFSRRRVDGQTWLQGDQKVNNGANGEKEGFASITCGGGDSTTIGDASQTTTGIGGGGGIIGAAAAAAVAAAQAVVDMVPKAPPNLGGV